MHARSGVEANKWATISPGPMPIRHLGAGVELEGSELQAYT